MFSSKHHDLQKILFGEIVFDDDFRKIIKLQNDVQNDDFKNAKMMFKMMILKMLKENDDFKNAKIYKIYEDLNNTRDVIYIGSTCDKLSKCMSKFRIKSKSRVNWSYDKSDMMIRSSCMNCKIDELNISLVILLMN